MFSLWFVVLVVTTCTYALNEEHILEFLGKNQMRDIFNEEIQDAELNYELVSPIRVDHVGNPRDRFVRSMESPNEMLYTINAFGQDLKLHLQKGEGVFTDGMDFVARHGDVIIPLVKETVEDNFYEGKVVSHDNYPVALSIEDGLIGMISTPTADYIIRPIPHSLITKRSFDSKDHILFKRSRTEKIKCGVDTHHHFVSNASISRDVRAVQSAFFAQKLIIESALFVDYSMFSYYSGVFGANANAEMLKYFLAVMSTVQYIYNNGNLGKQFKFVIVKFEIFTKNPVSLNVHNDAHIYLASFCRWQDQMNIKDDTDPRHWDHGFMFTALDLHINNPVHMNAMAGRPIKGNGKPRDSEGVCALEKLCKSDESCSLSHGRGFSTTFTVAHELGHNFGMNHEGEGNQCRPGDWVMTAGDYITPFSSCSKTEFTNYIKLPLSACLLDDRQAEANLNHEIYNNKFQGTIYDMDQQCQMGHGKQYKWARFLDQETLCESLWCVDATNKYSDRNPTPSMRGTTCGPNKWCINRKCVRK